MGFHYADYIIFVFFLAFSLSIGLYHAFKGGKQKTTEDFLMGGRKLSTFPVAISITLSFISAILVLGQSAEVYTRGTQFSVVFIGHLIGCIFVVIFIAPIFFNLKVTSSFEYLELRFNSQVVKLIGTSAMLICSTIQLGIVLYAPSVALEAVTGVPIWMSIIISSLVAIIYTTLGGMKAVIWTDVFQGCCVLVGMLAVVVQGTLELGGPFEVWERNKINSRLEFFNMNPNPSERTTFWSSVASGVFFNLAAFGVGQTTVQRYCALPCLAKARCSLIMSTCLLSISILLTTAVGMVIFAYYEAIGCDPVRANRISSPNQLLPYFVMDVLKHPGISGLFVSVLFAGALSTMSSSLNSAAAVTWQDILKKFFKHLDDSNKALVTKLLVLIYGVTSVAMAFLAEALGGHVLQTANAVVGTFGGPILGLFILGMFCRRSNSKGAILGCLCGTATTIWIAIGSLVANQGGGEALPTSVAFCQSSELLHNTSLHLTTAAASAPFQRNETLPTRGDFLSAIYSLSYLLYPIVGFLITVTVGMVASLVTWRANAEEINPNLLAGCSRENVCLE